MTAEALLAEEVRAVLRGPAAEAAWRALAEPGAWGENDPRPMYRLLGAHRLLAPAWPAEFGGRGLSTEQAAVVTRELIAAGVPDTLQTLSVQICGTFLLTAGAPAQRATLLPALAAGQRYCTVLYTEPEAGSDLAALRTRAEPDGAGGWRITGHKVFSVRTALADLGLVAARTAEEAAPYQGLTLFLVPLDAPGVTVSRLASLADEAFADVRLDGVPAGPDSVVGEVGSAWPLITEALALERTGVDHAAKAAVWLSAAAEAARQGAVWRGGGWREDAGRLRTRAAAARELSARCAAELDRGELSPVVAAATKLWCSETAREVAAWSAEALGEMALWQAADEAAVAGGRLEAAYREAPGLVISAGTSEMMRELVAGAGLSAALAAPGWSRPADGAQSARGPAGVAPAGGVVPAIRAAVRSAARPGPGDPAAWADLAGLGLFRLSVPPGRGGLGLGLLASAAACEELGGCGVDAGLLDTMAVAQALAAGPVSGPAEGALPGLLDGTVRGALAFPQRPGRPLTDPGPGGLLLIIGRTGRPADIMADPVAGELPGPGPGPALWVAAAGASGVVRQQHATMAGQVTTVHLSAAVGPAPLERGDGAVRDLIAASWLRRAAWLLGAGASCLSAAEERAGARRQFGRTLLSNQALAHKLAGLAVHGEALRTLLRAQAARPGEGAAGRSGTGAGLEVAACAGLLAEAGRFARRAAEVSVHLHGASGMTAGSPPARAYLLIPLAIAGGPDPRMLDQLAAEPLTSPGGGQPAGPAGRTG